MITFQVIPVKRPITQFKIDWVNAPSYEQINALVAPWLGHLEPLKHVCVLHKAKFADMFVSELGQTKPTSVAPWPINRRATEMYQYTLLVTRKIEDRHNLPTIAGPAILFHQQVWFSDVEGKFNHDPH